MNTPVKFETAKLLKEKKYGNKTPHKLRRNYYNHLGELNGDVTDYVKAFVNKEELTHLETIDAPTIADVLMWLYEAQGIWIVVSISRYGNFYCNVLMREDTKILLSLDNPSSWEMQTQINDFYSPTEVYETAIEYTLKNLI